MPAEVWPRSGDHRAAKTVVTNLIDTLGELAIRPGSLWWSVHRLVEM
jgi:predicted dinucleotide-binding enzyme